VSSGIGFSPFLIKADITDILRCSREFVKQKRAKCQHLGTQQDPRLFTGRAGAVQVVHFALFHRMFVLFSVYVFLNSKENFIQTNLMLFPLYSPL
jgi:hypothetical protein